MTRKDEPELVTPVHRLSQASQCTAVDRAGHEVSFDPRAPARGTLRTIDAGHAARRGVLPGGTSVHGRR